MVRQQAWVVDVEIRAEGRGAEIAKRSAIIADEKVTICRYISF